MFRNRLSHNYDDIASDIVWAIIVEDLPRLHDVVVQVRDDLDRKAS